MKSIHRFGFIALAAFFCAALLTVNGTSGCSKNCGNGVLDAGEGCDDGNTADGDGCSAACELETGGTTGGGTTGGTTTGGTGGADGCSTPADCPSSFSSAPVCETPSTCQGSRKDATCVGGACGSILIPDDSACTADSFTLDCSPSPNVSCDGTVAQVPPACPEPEVCNDLVDNDLDGLVDCADTTDCPNSTTCNLNPGTGFCSNGICSD